MLRVVAVGISSRGCCWSGVGEHLGGKVAEEPRSQQRDSNIDATYQATNGPLVARGWRTSCMVSEGRYGT